VFDKLLLCAIDEALNSLGKSVRQAIYFYIENQFSVPRNEIPRNLQQFQEGLERIFGAGVQFVESLIIKNLATKFGRPLIMGKSGQIELIEYVNAAKQSYTGTVIEHTVESQEDYLSFLPVFTVSVAKP
jgi:hypothetical protein